MKLGEDCGSSKAAKQHRQQQSLRRFLATKSAETAKDIGGLIAGSIEKSELGAKIAGETSQSLSEIVVGINESSAIIQDITRYSSQAHKFKPRSKTKKRLRPHGAQPLLLQGRACNFRRIV